MPDTYAEHVAGEKLLIQFGDGAGPEVFTHSCSINTDRKITFSSDVYTSQAANCTNPSKPAMPRRRVKGKDLDVTGAGMSDAPSFKVLLQLWESGEPFNAKIKQDAGAAKGWTVSGEFVIESLSTGGARGEDQAFDISIKPAGDFTIAYDA